MTRRAAVAATVLSFSLLACPSAPETPVTPSQHTLPTAAETELAAIRADPADAIGFGDKTYLPYVLRKGDYLARSDDAAVLAALASGVRDPANPRGFRLALLHLLAAHPGADGTIVSMLGDPELRPIAAHLLGRAGFKGAPPLTLAVPRVLDALRAYLDDPTPYVDPWYQRTFRAGDFALAAFIRLAGPARFPLADPELASFIGFELPRFDDATRDELVAACRAMR